MTNIKHNSKAPEKASQRHHGKTYYSMNGRRFSTPDNALELSVKYTLAVKELIRAKRKIGMQSRAAAARTLELAAAVRQLKEADNHLTEYAEGLVKIMFMVAHRIRLPIANIKGLVNLLETKANTPEKQKKILDKIQKCVVQLDEFTKDLTVYINALEQKVHLPD